MRTPFCHIVPISRITPQRQVFNEAFARISFSFIWSLPQVGVGDPKYVDKFYGCFGLWSADGATGPGIAEQLKWLKSNSKMTFQGRGESDSKMTQNLTLSQRRVIFGVIFESLFLDPEKSFLSHRKCHFWVWDLWPNGVSQVLGVNSPALILSKNSGISLAAIS